VNEEGIMVGYAKHSKAWIILVKTPAGFVIRESMNVDCDDDSTSTALCDALRECPDADIQPAAGSYSDVIVFPLEKSKGAVAPHVSDTVTEDTLELMGRADAEPVDAAEGVSNANEELVGTAEVVSDINEEPRNSAEGEDGNAVSADEHSNNGGF
jgi:hypothetical protein